ncbi:MAG: hypothetical protein R3E79_62275 [Caldilineaceae bacterium]
MNNTELCFTPATELAAAIRTRQLSPVEVASGRHVESAWKRSIPNSTCLSDH